MFHKRAKLLITEKALSEPRLVNLIELLGLNWDREAVVFYQEPQELKATNLNSEALVKERKDAHLKRLRELFGKRLKEVRKQEKEQIIKEARAPHSLLIVDDFDEVKYYEESGVKILCLEKLYIDLRPDYLPGKELKVTITKIGKTENEGIGYLESGIKVVVNNGAKALGQELEVVVTGSIETTVGKLIFARPKYEEVS
jgi:hypothetical protein